MKETQQIIDALKALNKATSNLADQLSEIREEVVKQMPGEVELLNQFDHTIGCLRALSNEPLPPKDPSWSSSWDPTAYDAPVTRNTVDVQDGVKVEDGATITHNEFPELS